MTDWKKENPPVTVYMPVELLEDLKEWMADNHQRSVSTAVVLIVEHFLKQDGRPLGSAELEPRVSALEDLNLQARLTTLEQQVKQMREALAAAGARTLAAGVEEHLAEQTSLSGSFNYTAKEAQEGLTKTEIIRRLGIPASRIKRLASEERMTEEQYIAKISGWKPKPGEGERPRYFPLNA